MIENARHYIYIENQFFVSLINHADVRNEICAALCDRIVRAHEFVFIIYPCNCRCRNNEHNFRVYVMMPLMPAFEGQLGTAGGALQAVMHWTFLSISKGSYALFTHLKLRGGGDDWTNDLIMLLQSKTPTSTSCSADCARGTT